MLTTFSTLDTVYKTESSEMVSMHVCAMGFASIVTGWCVKRIISSTALTKV